MDTLSLCSDCHRACVIALLQFQKKAARSKGDRGQKKELGAMYDGAQIVQVRWVMSRVSALIDKWVSVGGM